MKESDVLLAKRPKECDNPQSAETLVGHIKVVMQVSEALIDTVGAQATVGMGLERSMLHDLRHALVRSACLHDLGKANSQFQRALQPGNQPPQAFRHEVIGTWLPLALAEMDRWLFAGQSDNVRWASLIAALGHHLKIESAQSIRAREGSGDSRIEVFCNHRDFHTCLSNVGKELGLSSVVPRLTKQEIDLLSTSQLPELHQWLLDATEWYENAEATTRRFVALTKALLIAADVAGSAAPRAAIDPPRWARDVLSRVCLSEQLNEIAVARLKGQPHRDFQKTVAESRQAVTLVKAGCGSGKTIAAYLWAARQATGRKLFFCYPTTGTATEGFREYVIPAEMAPDSRLLHSRSECDLEYLRESADDGEVNALQHAMAIESLSSWDVPLVLCTVDQVLAIVQNGRRALFSSPSVVNGAFVFDEIHQYDDRVFAALLRFMETFPRAPTLLMTASLPRPRLEAIRKLLHARGEELNVIEGPPDLERIPRYIIEKLQDEPPWAMIDKVLAGKGKILWVANTVDRCVQFAQQALRQGYAPTVYHSRYRYVDRIRKHRAVIDGFQKAAGSLAITTQVCEVSLDLSSDLLITDLAPAPALIQRMGRLNRRANSQHPGTPKPAIVLRVSMPHPYAQEEMETATAWLDVLGPGPHSQASLAAAFEMTAPIRQVESVKSAWLDTAPLAVPAPLREAGATVPVVRAEDEAMCIDAFGRLIPKQVAWHAIPMLLKPVYAEVGRWKQLGYAFLAPAGRVQYSEEWGARWQGRK